MEVVEAQVVVWVVVEVVEEEVVDVVEEEVVEVVDVVEDEETDWVVEVVDVEDTEVEVVDDGVAVVLVEVEGDAVLLVAFDVLELEDEVLLVAAVELGVEVLLEEDVTAVDDDDELLGARTTYAAAAPTPIITMTISTRATVATPRLCPGMNIRTGATVTLFKQLAGLGISGIQLSARPRETSPTRTGWEPNGASSAAVLLSPTSKARRLSR